MKNEKRRLAEDKAYFAEWKKWGPYLAERQWGTVREDYSFDGSAWEYVTFDDARSKAYRWGEDGIAGICDDRQLLCFALAFWNENDPFLKERFFGLTEKQGSHGECVQELYHYLDNTPTHSYMVMSYKYPQAEFPYQNIILENLKRDRFDQPYGILDTGIFDSKNYFDIFVEYAKQTPEDILVRVTIHNRGDAEAVIHVLPHIWFRNTWQGKDPENKPLLASGEDGFIECEHEELGTRYIYCDNNPELLFCDNETNLRDSFVTKEERRYFKDGINDYVVLGNRDAVNPAKKGTKAAAHYTLTIPRGKFETVTIRLSDRMMFRPFGNAQKIFRKSIRAADHFHNEIQWGLQSNAFKNLHRQAVAGLLSSKQFYYYNVADWTKGNEVQSGFYNDRRLLRNSDWQHVDNEHVVSVPDKWKNPWYASWDLALSCIAIADSDPEFAKKQLLLLTSPEFMHPSGQIPANEWNFGALTPSLLAWAALYTYRTDRELNKGIEDIPFLESIFHKLLLNYHWWMNVKDESGRTMLQGGHIAFENNDIFSREDINLDGKFTQSYAVPWMAANCLHLMVMAVELSQKSPAYQNLALKLFEDYLLFGESVNDMWDEETGMFFDTYQDGSVIKMPTATGLIPLLGVELFYEKKLENCPDLLMKIEAIRDTDSRDNEYIFDTVKYGKQKFRMFSLLNRERLERMLKHVLDEQKFLSKFGLVSSCSQESPRIDILISEDAVGSYSGGKEGKIWVHLNFLIMECLKRYYVYYGDELKVPCPANSGEMLNLSEVVLELSKRILLLFARNRNLRREQIGDPNFSRYLDFYEYYDADTGIGQGASHKTGWTGLINNIVMNLTER